MEEILKRYARLIVTTQLKLESGDVLSINTEGRYRDFARILAKAACEATQQVVNIVETNHGKVAQVVQIDPAEPEIFRPEKKGPVMCHVFNLDDTPFSLDEEPASLASDVAKLGMFGLLAEPVFLDRKIAVPWANIPLPGPNWASLLLGEEATVAEMWELFAAIFRLGEQNPAYFWESQGNLLHFRKQKLNKLGPLELELTGSEWSLQTRTAPDTVWAGGVGTVPAGRQFIAHLPMQNVFASLDCTASNGTVTSSRPFMVLGKIVEDASFEIENGKVTSYRATRGKDALDAYFSVDEGASRVCELSLADEDTLESRYIPKGIHVHFNRATTTHLTLGGFDLATLTDQDSDEAIDNSHLSRSLVRLEVPVGDNRFSVAAIDTEKDRHELVEEGIFLD
jgi:aminopeptidase